MKFVLLIAATLSLLATPTLAQESIDGTWRGNLECSGRRYYTTLVLDGNSAGNVTGTLSFSAPTGPASYKVYGTVTPEGALSLKPERWIQQPPEVYTMFPLEGRAYGRRAEGKSDVLFGDVPLTNCGKFALERQ